MRNPGRRWCAVKAKANPTSREVARARQNPRAKDPHRLLPRQRGLPRAGRRDPKPEGVDRPKGGKGQGKEGRKGPKEEGAQAGKREDGAQTERWAIRADDWRGKMISLEELGDYNGSGESLLVFARDDKEADVAIARWPNLVPCAHRS